MPKSLIRSLAQIIVVLWLLILCSRYLLLTACNVDKILIGDPSIRVAMGLGILVPGAIVALLIVTPTRSGRFMVPDRVEGAAAYLCAALRGCVLIKLAGSAVLVGMMVQSAYLRHGAFDLWTPVAPMLSEFVGWAVLAWLAPWLSMAVVRQVDTGVMWYTRAWQSLKGLLSPE